MYLEQSFLHCQWSGELVRCIGRSLSRSKLQQRSDDSTTALVGVIDNCKYLNEAACFLNLNFAFASLKRGVQTGLELWPAIRGRCPLPPQSHIAVCWVH